VGIGMIQWVGIGMIQWVGIGMIQRGGDRDDRSLEGVLGG
jgi:hypothetical protein